VTQALYTTEFVIGFAADGRIQIVEQHVRASPELPPSGWSGRLKIAYLNTRFDVKRGLMGSDEAGRVLELL
jgi:hypothetical protein